MNKLLIGVVLCLASSMAQAQCVPTRDYFPLTQEESVAPERSSVGKGYILSGVVRSSADCKPIAAARIIYWMANPDGEYDEAHRGTIFSDAQGRYRFESSFPGNTGTDPHIHVAVVIKGYRTISTIYFPRQGQAQGTFDLVLLPEG